MNAFESELLTRLRRVEDDELENYLSTSPNAILEPVWLVRKKDFVPLGWAAICRQNATGSAFSIAVEFIDKDDQVEIYNHVSQIPYNMLVPEEALL